AYHHPHTPSFPTRRSSDLCKVPPGRRDLLAAVMGLEGVTCEVSVVRIAGDGPPDRDRRRQEERAASVPGVRGKERDPQAAGAERSEEHTSELQSQSNLVCR